MSNMSELVGKTIVGLRVGRGEEVLTFDHPDGTSTSYETDGDCCSETWFADITGVNVLLDHTVLSAESVEMDEVLDGRCRQESDIFYGEKLTTDKGIVDIVYRNSSNGFYGGDIYLYTGKLPDDMKPITDDWSA